MKQMTRDDIRAFREARKLSQAELAKMLRVRRETVSRWELGYCAVPGPVAVLLAIWAATDAEERRQNGDYA